MNKETAKTTAAKTNERRCVVPNANPNLIVLEIQAGKDGAPEFVDELPIVAWAIDSDSLERMDHHDEPGVAIPISIDAVAESSYLILDRTTGKVTKQFFAPWDTKEAAIACVVEDARESSDRRKAAADKAT